MSNAQITQDRLDARRVERAVGDFVDDQLASAGFQFINDLVFSLAFSVIEVLHEVAQVFRDIAIVGQLRTNRYINHSQIMLTKIIQDLLDVWDDGMLDAVKTIPACFLKTASAQHASQTSISTSARILHVDDKQSCRR